MGRAEHTAFVYSTARNLPARPDRAALARLGIAPLRMEDEDIPDLDALRHLERLSPDQRETVRLRVLEELDYDEIAARTGASEPAVRQRVSRGLKWLRRRLDEDER